MTNAEFLSFNEAWMARPPHLRDGGIVGTFIDWRGLPTVHSAALKLGLASLNLIVWAKTNAGMGRLDGRSMNSCRYSRKARLRTSTTSNSVNEAVGVRTRGLIPALRRSAPTRVGASRVIQPPCWRTPSRSHESRRYRHRPVPRLRIDPHRRRQDPSVSRGRARPAVRRCNRAAL
jgi:hypothetical protein